MLESCRVAFCLLVQRAFLFLDTAFFEPHNGIGHIVIARKPETAA